MIHEHKLPSSIISLISCPSPIEFFVKYGFTPKEILHVGAHLAEEKVKYEELGVKESLWVEAQPEIFEKLSHIVGDRKSLNVAVWSKKTNLQFHVAGNSVSSSVLSLDSDNPWVDLDFVKEIEVQALTLDDVIAEFQNRGFLALDFFLVLDIQGAEYEALKGWRARRSKTSAISCEVSKYKGYAGASRRWQINLRMLRFGFLPGAAFLSSETGHGDQLYVKIRTAVSNPKILILSFVRYTLLKLIKIKSYYTQNLS